MLSVFLYERISELPHGQKRVRYATDHYLTKDECPILGVNGGANFINWYTSVAEFMEVRRFDMQGFRAVTSFARDNWGYIIDSLLFAADKKQHLFGVWVEE